MPHGCCDHDSNLFSGNIDNVVASRRLIDTINNNEQDRYVDIVDRMQDAGVYKNQPYYFKFDPTGTVLYLTEALGSFDGVLNEEFIRGDSRLSSVNYY